MTINLIFVNIYNCEGLHVFDLLSNNPCFAQIFTHSLTLLIKLVIYFRDRRWSCKSSGISKQIKCKKPKWVYAEIQRKGTCLWNSKPLPHSFLKLCIVICHLAFHFTLYDKYCLVKCLLLDVCIWFHVQVVCNLPSPRSVLAFDLIRLFCIKDEFLITSDINLKVKRCRW